MSSIVILGAGPAGALAALCLARRGHSVTIIDRDSLPSLSFEKWRQRGIPHARQGHIFLALGTRVLQQEIPEVVENVIATGAQRVALKHDSSNWNLFTRRQHLDGELRRALVVEPGVRFLPATVATGLLIKQASTEAPPHVLGLRTREGPIIADLVVDAAGRRSPSTQWLAADGVKLHTMNHPSSFFYITRHYRLRSTASFPSIRVPIIAALPYATALAFPEDNGHFQLTVQLDIRDLCRRALRDSVIFDRFLAEVPLIAPWLAAGDGIGETEVFASFGNGRRRTFYERPLVTGLILLGDAAVHTNPTAGRGVALGLAHAQALANAMDQATNARCDPVTLCEKWDQRTSQLLDPWLQSQIQIDSDRQAQIRTSIEGRPWHESDSISNRLISAVATQRDCEVLGAAGDRMFNLLATPEEIYKDRNVMRQILREARRSSPQMAFGPSRDEFERLAREYCDAGY